MKSRDKMVTTFNFRFYAERDKVVYSGNYVVIEFHARLVVVVLC
jgi:hypothetical protein